VRALIHGGRGEGGADRGGPQRRERGRARGGKETGADSLAPLAATGREESAGQSGADRRGPPVRGGRRAGTAARLGLVVWFGPNWLFLFPFL
jgi:hypothetical protein